ncbi:HTH-type transcriptional regulator [Legionella busanensis]|uniref:HTH-type transcriptional regulator n=2 Tax=Legionella busanensis TaxID=190655 RepID=A0A378KAG2_9GAMM|nr:helix-turn-helix transcriptional regulator [Legionella busanensis]STX81489.1 HTH-type transcriptional regulator [Legionella busanensis]
MSNKLVKNLNTLMINHNLNTLNLSRETQIPQPTLHHLLSGKTKKPRSVLLKKLADFFNVSVPVLLETELSHNKSIDSIMNFPILSWNQETLCFYKQALDNELIVGTYPENCFSFFIRQKFCHSSWPNQSLAVIAPNKPLEDATYGLVYLKKHGLILNKIYKEQGNYFIKFNKTADEVLLLKINLDEARWFGQLIELRLARQALDDYL